MRKKQDTSFIVPEAIEYQSDALELEHKKLPWFGRCGILLIALLFVVVLIWASIGKVDIIVEAEGKLIASSRNIVMKPLERTVIQEINVVVGQTVKKGEVLITFDPTFNQADEERLSAQYKSLAAQFNRLKAEFEDKSFTGELDKTRDSLWQAVIFRKRRKFYLEKMNYFKHNINRIKAAAHTTEESYLKQEERMKTLVKIETMFDTLYQKKAISHKQLLETQISRLQMETDVDQLKNRISELQHELLSAEASKNSFIEEWDKTVSEEMVDIERKMSDAHKKLDKAKRLNSLDKLRSPCDAIVHDISQLSAGSAVREAESLITLVPINCKIEAEVNISPRDIGQVKIGDSVRIKLNAFPFQKHDTLDGKLRLISEDTFQDESGARGQKSFAYHSRITVTGKLTNVPNNFRLIPGMELKAEIKVGKRRIITYLIHPFIKALDESFREP